MQYRTHVTTSLAIGLPIMTATNTLSLSGVIALALGSVSPDIDEPRSWIGSRTRGASDITKGLFGHRGLTHSFIGIALASLVVFLILKFTSLDSLTGAYFILGYGLHLVEDSFSKSGVKWLLPISKKSFQFGLGIIYYETGKLFESFIFLISSIFVIWQLSNLNFNEFQYLQSFEIVPIFTDILNKSRAFIESKI